MISWKIYRHPNGICSDEAFTYCALYAGSRLTLSDRVHACVAIVAYGRPAMLFSRSPRARLFERLGLADIRKRPVQLASALRQELIASEIEFLRSSLN